ncbi:MAG: DUF4320 family protein [Oscillospiraceae bacterium]
MSAKIMKRIFAKIKSKSGMTFSIEAMIWIVVLLGLLLGFLEYARHMSRISDCQQIADSMSRQIALKGAVDTGVDEYLHSLEQIFHMDVEMAVAGNFMSGTNKLQAETSFEVTITYKTDLAIGIIKSRKEKVYAAKAVGTSEEYH